MSAWDFAGVDDNDNHGTEQDLFHDSTGDGAWDAAEHQDAFVSTSTSTSTSTSHAPPRSAGFPPSSRAHRHPSPNFSNFPEHQSSTRGASSAGTAPYLEGERLDSSASNLDQDEQATRPTAVSTPTSYGSHEFVTLEDSDSDDINHEEEEEEIMPPATRRQRQCAGVVDLTEILPPAPAPAPARESKRKRSTDIAASSSDARAKRRRVPAEDIEEIDLANEAPSAEEGLLQAQQQEAIRAQQLARDNSAPQKIGRRQCIICMENFTNCTATACGHFFCHECLIQALIASAKNSDRGNGSCPVCRKSLSHKKKGDVLPIAFMTKQEYDKNYKGKQST